MWQRCACSREPNFDCGTQGTLSADASVEGFKNLTYRSSSLCTFRTESLFGMPFVAWHADIFCGTGFHTTQLSCARQRRHGGCCFDADHSATKGECTLAGFCAHHHVIPAKLHEATLRSHLNNCIFTVTVMHPHWMHVSMLLTPAREHPLTCKTAM